MLSRRLLNFDKTRCFYHCNSATYYEDAFTESDYVCSHPEKPPSRDDQFDVSAELMEDQYLDLDRHIKYLTKPNSGDGDRLKQYRAAFGGYITRSLSRDDDAVNAFRGILNTLEEDLRPFFWGMPEAEFGVCIAWRWLDGTRGSTDAASSPTALRSLHSWLPPLHARSSFPTWSWLSQRIDSASDSTVFQASDQTLVPLAIYYRFQPDGTPVKIRVLFEAPQSPVKRTPKAVPRLTVGRERAETESHAGPTMQLSRFLRLR